MNILSVKPRSRGTRVLLGETRVVTGASTGAHDLPLTTPMPFFLGSDDTKALQADLSARASAIDAALRSSSNTKNMIPQWEITKRLIDKFASQSVWSWNWTTPMAVAEVHNKLIWRDGQAAEYALIRWEKIAEEQAGYESPFKKGRPFDWSRWFPYGFAAIVSILGLGAAGYFMRSLPSIPSWKAPVRNQPAGST